MKTLIAIITAIALVVSTSAPSFAHSGGTNSAGCHAGSKPYHCHNKKPQSKPFDSGDSSNSTGIIIGIVGIVLGVVVIFSFMGDSNDTISFDADGNPLTKEGKVTTTIKW